MKTVTIDEDIFIDLLWDRVDEFKDARGYGKKFWEECFEFLSDIGWFEPRDMNPLIIVDNIAVNGEIWHKDDCADNYDEINEDYDGDVKAWVEDNGYLIWDDWVVVNLGLN